MSELEDLKKENKKLESKIRELKKEFKGNILLVKDEGILKLHSDSDQDNLRGHADGTMFIAKKTNISPRSLKQLAKFNIVCKYVAQHNSEDKNLNTKDKVKERLKIIHNFVDCYYYYYNKKTEESELNIKTKSLGFENCEHKDATDFISNGYGTMADWMDVPVEQLTRQNL